MKSEPELAELVEAVEGVEVTMAEKGFGTRVAIRADEGSGLAGGRSRGGPGPPRRTAAAAVQLSSEPGQGT